MARVTLTKTLAPNSFPAAGVALTMTAADATNFNQFVMTGAELLLAWNSGLSTRTVTVTSASDERGRSGTISAENILAGVTRMYGPFTNKVGWVQSNGMLYCQANHADVKFAVIQLHG